MLDIISDCLSDSLKMLPLIFLTYVIIELIERKADFAKNGRFLTGKAAPVLGSLAGAFPRYFGYVGKTLRKRYHRRRNPSFRVYRNERRSVFHSYFKPSKACAYTLTLNQNSNRGYRRRSRQSYFP